MNTPDHSLTDDALDDSAAAWLCERDEGFTPERAQAFDAWCDCDPRHEAAVARVERALALLGEMPAVRAPLEARFGRTSGTPAPASARVIRFRIRPWAAGIAAALAIGAAIWWVAELRAPAGERYVTEAAAQRRVALQDGSVVDINAASDMRVRFTERERRVTLTAGEAHFEVAHDGARPFVVTAAGVSVRAVGTAFSVRLAAGAVDVLVVEGKVEVGETTTVAEALPLPPRNGKPFRYEVSAGERTVVRRSGNLPQPILEKPEPTAIRAMLAWQDPLTTFRDVPLREIVARLNLRNPTQLLVADAELSERKIGGVIALDQVEAFVRLLEQGGDVVSERRGAGEIVLRRAR